MNTVFTISVLAVAILAAYLLGSLPFAVIVSRTMGLNDPRSYGSGNPGATNVLRSGSKTAAALTLLGDAGKGFLAVLLAKAAVSAGLLAAPGVALAGLAAFCGHLWPVFLGFKGGKGVATALGVLLGLQPWLALAAALTWLAVAFITRYSSLAAVLAAIFTPFYYLLGGNVLWRHDATTISVVVVISVLLLTRHKANITRLLAGKEGKIGKKK